MQQLVATTLCLQVGKRSDVQLSSKWPNQREITGPERCLDKLLVVMKIDVESRAIAPVIRTCWVPGRSAALCSLSFTTTHHDDGQLSEVMQLLACWNDRPPQGPHSEPEHSSPSDSSEEPTENSWNSTPSTGVETDASLLMDSVFTAFMRSRIGYITSM